MIVVLILVMAIAWLVVGATGFVFWWTTDLNLTTSELGLLLAVALMGPVAWYMGWSIHAKKHNKVLIYRRGGCRASGGPQ